MPLCNIVSITGVNTTFIVAMAFMKQERETDYSWVLEQLRASTANNTTPGVIVTDRDLALMNALVQTFPNAKHLLCKWHIRKNVEARCWPFFKDLPTTAAGTAEQKWSRFLSDWDKLVSSLSVREFERQWAALKARHRLHSLALQYLQAVWLNDHKERFVYAWTHKHLHLNTVVTSRVEGCHSVLKRYICVSNQESVVV
jgi:histone-lysine N-methyltransferase SETD2